MRTADFDRRPLSALFVDGVPVLFGDMESFLLERLVPLGDRVTVGEWWGGFPLEGVLLERSIHLCDEVVSPLCEGAPWWRP